MRHLATILSFDVETEDGKKCYEVISSMGKGAKHFIKYALLFKYRNCISVSYDSSGRKTVTVTNDGLKKMIEKYAKDNVKLSDGRNPGNTIFINWLRSDKDDMECISILKPFRGGINDFVTDLLKEVYPAFFNNSGSLPALNKAADTKKIPKSVKPAEVKKPEPASHNPPENDPDDDIELPDMRELVDKQIEEMKRPKRMDLSKLE